MGKDSTVKTVIQIQVTPDFLPDSECIYDLGPVQKCLIR